LGVAWLEDRYYVTWCNGYHGPTIGIRYTFDFEIFVFLEYALLPYNRNGVLFPRKINGRYFMLSRPSDNDHTPFGDIPIYCGGADTVTALAFARRDEALDFVKTTSEF
jgi:predicted GH43/DUF377 family glycosyl hydrolase